MPLKIKKKLKFTFSLIFFALNLFAQDSEIDILRRNLIHDAVTNHGFSPRIERYITPAFEETSDYLDNLNKNGSWRDVNYRDRDNKWNPLMHLNRLIVMIVNYHDEKSELFQSPTLLAGVEKAIAYWYEINPICDNWYKNEIAKQFYFNVIALLTQGKIDAALHQKMVNDLTENPTRTGSNRTLLATSTLYRGVITNDPKMIKLAVSGVTDQIIVTTEEGIQPDYSFHQHGRFIYNGNYGFNYLRESVWMATIVHSTAFAYSAEHIKILRDYFLNGTRWMIRGGLIDYNVRGRQVGRHDGFKLYADLLIPILKQMMVVDPDFASQYEISIQRIRNKEPQLTLGNKHFWRSDYVIHHRENYSVSLKMCSERTIGIELNMNSENKLGYWLPYGLSYIYTTGDEYHGIFPSWDWARLPGVTNPYIEIEEKEKGASYTQPPSFVGGVSDGKYGISTMDFSKAKTSAKKAWFWFDNEWVALGTGIRSAHDAPIVTGINQCLQKGAVVIDGKTSTQTNATLKNPSWVLHDGVGYVFPKEVNIQYAATVQKGNMQRIYGLGNDTIYSQKVFSLWFDHGIHPNDEKYEYLVVPGVNAKQLTEYVKNPPISILENTAQIQAVSQTDLQLIGVVFHVKGEMQRGDLLIRVDNPCIVLLDQIQQTISLSDPTGELTKIDVTIKQKGAIIFDNMVLLPKGEFAGKTVAQPLGK